MKKRKVEIRAVCEWCGERSRALSPVILKGESEDACVARLQRVWQDDGWIARARLTLCPDCVEHEEVVLRRKVAAIDRELEGMFERWQNDRKAGR